MAIGKYKPVSQFIILGANICILNLAIYFELTVNLRGIQTTQRARIQTRVCKSIKGDSGLANSP